MNKYKIIELVWKDDLSWCPSQCYGLFLYHLQPVELYLRWRSDDPWTGCILIRGEDKVVWSENLFAKNHRYYADNELDLAKKNLIKFAEKEINKVDKVPFEDLPTLINSKDRIVSILANAKLRSPRSSTG